MDIDLGNEVVFNVKFRGETYPLREPIYADVKKMQGRPDDNDAVIDFLVDLGMPKDVIDTMGITKFQKLVETLTSSISEKK